METGEIKYMIDLYSDGELGKEKEPLLFSLLSQDSEAREYFKGVNYIKNSFQQNMSEFPHILDEKILYSAVNTQHKQPALFTNKNMFLFLSYSLIAALIFISVMFYKQSADYKHQSELYRQQFFSLTNDVKKQNSDLQLILNAMPEIEVRSGYYRTKEIIVRANL